MHASRPFSTSVGIAHGFTKTVGELVCLYSHVQCPVQCMRPQYTYCGSMVPDVNFGGFCEVTARLPPMLFLDIYSYHQPDLYRRWLLIRLVVYNLTR